MKKQISLAQLPLFTSPWLASPMFLEQLGELPGLDAESKTLTRAGIALRAGNSTPARKPPQQPRQVAVMNLFGLLLQREDVIFQFIGGTALEIFGEIFTELVSSSGVHAIIINTDSHGGTFSGVQELSDKIFNARGSKPVIAIANPSMTSAAYWIGSAADEVVAIPSAVEIGGLGVALLHRDDTARDKKEGVTYTTLRSVEYKAEGGPHEPLSDSARDHLQETAGKMHSMLVDGVARNRGVSVAHVETNYGRGRTLLAEDALAAGLVDRIATLDEVLRGL